MPITKSAEGNWGDWAKSLSSQLGSEEVLKNPEAETTFVRDDLYDGVVPANEGDTDGDETAVIDIDCGPAGVHLSTDGEVISAQDENGKPIAGRYPWDPVSSKITDMVLEGADKDEITKAIEESRVFLDGLKSDNEVYHLDAYKRQAHAIAVDKTTEWIRQHPGYSMEELQKAKAGFLDEAMSEILKAITELAAERREKLTDAHAEHD